MRFLDIPAVVSAALEGVSLAGSDSVEGLLAKDEEARAFALQRVAAC